MLATTLIVMPCMHQTHMWLTIHGLPALAGAQCAHAALGVTQSYRSRYEAYFKQWEYSGQAKIALKIDNPEDMVGRASGKGCLIDTGYSVGPNLP